MVLSHSLRIVGAMKYRTCLILLCSALLGACATQNPTFSWYHPMGGEYLFAYDRDECETSVVEQGMTLGTDTQGPFFQCMHSRGYYLVDANAIVQEPDVLATPAEQQVSKQ